MYMSDSTKTSGAAVSRHAAIPVLYTFFVMGFCDVVGVATSYVKTDFGLSETVSGFIPSMVFLWFLLLSVPTALLMNKIGRKNTVQLSNLFTFVGMMIPIFTYNFATCIIAFIFLGIGNTMLQVSLNPLLTNVVRKEKITSSLTGGQVIKAVSSFLGPFIAAFASLRLGNWKYLFPIYAFFTLLSAVSLMLTKLPEERGDDNGATGLKQTFSLLSDSTILLLVLGIVFVVGVDVGTNTVAPKLLMERAGLAVESAGLGSSVYFLARTVGSLLGTFLLVKLNDRKFFFYNILVAIAAVIILFFVQGRAGILALLAVIGFSCSCIFPIIFSLALKARPEKANEISGLMITGVFGGAVIPPLMGLMSDVMGSQAGSLLVIGLCMFYLLFCSVKMKSLKTI